MEGDLLVLDQVGLKKEAKNKDGTWSVCCITPGWGSSGYYSEDLLKSDGVTVLKEGLHNYWDHATLREEYDRPERSLRDLAGVLVENAKWKDDGWNGAGLYSTSKVFSMYQEALDEMAEHIGMSVVIYGTSHIGEAEGETGEIIDQITAARSVDFVTLPGRGGKVQQRFESLRLGSAPILPTRKPHKEANVVEEKEAQELREAKRKVEDDLRESKKSEEDLKKENGELKTENDKLRKENAEHGAAIIMGEVLDKVKGVPKKVRKRLEARIMDKVPFKEDGTLDKEKFGEVIQTEVKEEAAYLKGLGFGKVKGLGSTSTLEEAEDEDDEDDDPEEGDDDDDTDGTDDDEDDDDDVKESKRGTKLDTRMKEAMSTLLGGDKKKTKVAVGGRR